jgi:DNA-binding response OmpR family regulator
MAYRFLSITGDDNWEKKVARALAGQSAGCAATRSLSDAWRRISAGEADLALLDLDLPAVERLGWFRLLRQSEDGRRLPVVLVSRRKSDVELAEAFELSADDYVLKSCDERELLARLRSVLRRRFERELLFDGVLSAGPVALDKGRHVCRVRGKALSLNPREFELLETLLAKAGRVLSRPYLLETVWGMSRSASTRTVDVTVSRLRKALGSRAGHWIETVERYGYRFRDPEDAAR